MVPADAIVPLGPDIGKTDEIELDVVVRGAGDFRRASKAAGQFAGPGLNGPIRPPGSVFFAD